MLQHMLFPDCRSLMVREGQLLETDTLSELGIFGALLRRGDKVLLNREAGHLIRTKVQLPSSQTLLFAVSYRICKLCLNTCKLYIMGSIQFGTHKRVCSCLMLAMCRQEHTLRVATITCKD